MFSLKPVFIDGRNLWYGKFSVFPENEVVHAVSSRFGGFSEGAFKSLNLALHVGDEAEKVIENRKIFCRGLGLEPERMTTCRQVHGNKIARVDSENIGAGACSLADTIEGADALITNLKNVPLALFFADCTPIMIYDPVKRAAGIAHGGWRGTAGKIAFLIVKEMQRAFGTDPERCFASIGPSIGQCCYEIGDEVAEIFSGIFKEDKDAVLKWDCRSEKYHLDLWQANALMLQRAGLRAENIDTAGACTCCSSDIFFSYRADKGKTGRIAAVIALK